MPCLTAEQVSIFAKYNGNSDAIEYSGSDLEKRTVSQSAWIELMQFEQRLPLRERGILDNSAIRALEFDLNLRFCDESAISLMLRLVRDVLSKSV